MPKVSVILAVHNAGRFLRPAINSILAQRLSDFELLVIDDGSTDSSLEQLRGYSDERVRLLINESNLGLSRSLNRGLGAAIGEYVARLDADDLAEPSRLARQVAYLDSHPRVALIGSGYHLITDDDRIVRRNRPPLTDLDIRWAMLFYSPFAHSSVMFRRQPVCREVGLYDEALTYSMDYDLWRRIAIRFEVANLPQALIRLRVHEQSMTATLGERANEGHGMRLREVERLLEWDPHDRDQNDARLRAMIALHYGPFPSGPDTVMLQAADDMLRLHDAFVGREALRADVAARHRRRVERAIGRRLLACARGRVRYDPEGARHIAGRVRWHQPTAVFSTEWCRYLAKVARWRLPSLLGGRREVDT